MVKRLLIGGLLSLVLLQPKPATAMDISNLTARLQGAIMDAAIQEHFIAFMEGKGRRRVLKAIPFSDYKKMDRWLGGAPARFEDYNVLAEAAFGAISRQHFSGDLSKWAKEAWLSAYDFSPRLSSTTPHVGDLDRAWSDSETALRLFPERLFTLRRLATHKKLSSHCRESFEKWLLSREDEEGAFWSRAAEVYASCVLP